MLCPLLQRVWQSRRPPAGAVLLRNGGDRAHPSMMRTPRISNCRRYMQSAPAHILESISCARSYSIEYCFVFVGKFPGFWLCSMNRFWSHFISKTRWSSSCLFMWSSRGYQPPSVDSFKKQLKIHFDFACLFRFLNDLLKFINFFVSQCLNVAIILCAVAFDCEWGLCGHVHGQR